MNGYSIVPQPKSTIEDTASSIFAAKVSRTDPIMVTLDAYGETHEWGPVTWLGDAAPARGDRCLAFRDDHGDMWAAPDGAALADLAGRVSSLESAHVVVAPPTGSAAADTAAITAALAAAAGGVAELRVGIYATDATIVVPAGTVLRGKGWGSVISYSGSGAAVRVGSNTLSVDDPNTGSAVRDLRVNGTSSAAQAILLRGITRFKITNVRIDGFTAGDGIKFYGATFIGEINGGRIQNCLRGISAKKQAGFGDSGDGMAFNAMEVHGGLEIQACTTAIEIGDPTTTEIGAVVGLGSEIHGVTIENNAKGIWNVGGNVINIHDNYFEENADFDIRIGSTLGNTSTPVMCTIGANFINPDNGGIAIEVLRALHTRINPNYILGVMADTTTGIVLAADTAYTLTLPQFFNSVDAEYTDAGVGNIYQSLDVIAGGLHLDKPMSSGGVVRSYADTTAEIQLGNNAGQAAIYFSNALDVMLTRIQAGILGGISGLQLAAMASGTAPNNTIFRDSADDVIKVKNNSGVVSAI